MNRQVLVLHGPLLALPEVLGQPLEALDETLRRRGAELGLAVECVHSLSEVGLVDALLNRRAELNAVVINPSSLAPTAHTLADAVSALNLMCVEVQLKHDAKSRGRSALKRVVERQLHGKGVDGYVLALEAIAKKARTGPSMPSNETARKTIGRAPATRSQPSTKAAKTLGRGERPGEAQSDVISRATVRQKLQERLARKTDPVAFAAWARSQWLAISNGAPVESGQKALLEDVLLMLSTSAKASDHVILSYAAKLE
jgi:3-dehydroquinate dehydratase-2